MAIIATERSTGERHRHQQNTSILQLFKGTGDFCLVLFVSLASPNSPVMRRPTATAQTRCKSSPANTEKLFGTSLCSLSGDFVE
ncbi:hypothetical protein PBY51_015603 [Eleginops maclovinus]|uniref:Uncharacterized protein n=1 Tax=Eleginops maclovinus TaxID=56733 RepID=A0AAN7XP75_ELEMC|nr:hypothetical protein PBY51_015603 [Eleginops maclovinus]